MLTVIIFLVVLSSLVIAHEWGHFIVARKCGMKVYEFGLGFPPRLGGIYKDSKTKKWIWVWGKGKSNLKETVGGESREEEYPTTLYSFNILPLGGFVKIKGENGEDRHEKDSFMFHGLGKRSAVLVAGVTMNVIVAGILLAFGLMVGLPTDFGGGVDKHAIIVENSSVVIQQIQSDTPASASGLSFGDKILSINNVEMKNSSDMIEFVKNHGQEELELHIERGSENNTFYLTPELLKGENNPRLGIILADAGVIRYPWYWAIPKGFFAAIIGLINIFIGLFLLIKNLIIGNGMIFEVAGPVGIANAVGASAKLGLNYLIHISAMISLSLAALNILPIPALDGGRLLFVIIEKIIKKPVPMKYEQVAHTIGFLILMVLIIVVTWKDIAKII